MLRARHLVSALGFALAIAVTAPGCVVRGSGTVGVETTPGVVYVDPPAPRVENPGTRPGFIWISGHWQWNGSQYVWASGRWERPRAGYAWTSGHWDRSGNGWIWVRGNWAVSSEPVAAGASGGVSVGPVGPTPVVTTPPPNEGGVSVTGPAGGVSVTVSAYPTAEPPPLRVESPGTRAGFVWINGHWDWRGGQWAWIDGHWERPRAHMVWTAGRWESQGGRYVWVEGRWEAGGAPAGPVVRDHRTPAPPPPAGPVVRDHRH